MAERLQRLWGTILDLIGIDRSPPWLGEYETSNKLQRSLSHIVIQDGQNSRLVKGTTDGAVHVATPRDVAGLAAASGALLTAPLWAGTTPDDRWGVDQTATSLIDMSEARPRCLRFMGPIQGTDSVAQLWECSAAEELQALIGLATPYDALIGYSESRYLFMWTPTADNKAFLQAWNLS